MNYIDKLVDNTEKRDLEFYILVGGLSTFCAVPIFRLVVATGNRYEIGNLFLFCFMATTLIHPFWIWKTSKKLKDEEIELKEAERNMINNRIETHLDSIQSFHT